MADNYINTDLLATEERNRAYDTRRDNDVFKTPAVTIYDVDYAMLYHLKNNMQFSITENGKEIPVPVMFASSETWAQVQKNGYLRDKMRKIMTPVIMLRRTGLVGDDRFADLTVSTNNGANTRIVTGPVQTNSQYDWINKPNNNLGNRNKQSNTYFVSVLPDRVKVTYDLIIWTELTTDMNNIVQEINTQNRLLWGDVFQFVTRVSEFSFETLNQAGDDRIVKATTMLDVDGVLQMEYELRESTIYRAHSVKRVDFRNEVEQYELYPDFLPPEIPLKNRVETQ